MPRGELKGKAQTVLGVVNGAELGFTLPHEHLILEMRNYFVEPPDPRDLHYCDEPLSLENLHWVRYHHLSCKDNLVISDEDTAVKEVELFHNVGGRTIVDVTPINLGRNPAALARIAQRSGVNVIMGTAYYIDQSYTPEMRMDERTDEEIAELFIREISTGVENTGLRAGLIGELGCSWPLTTNERKVLRAGAIAQQETGAVISIHPGHMSEAPFEIMQVLMDAGADPTRVIMGHMELTVPIEARSTRAKLADMGCYLQFDQMGISELQMYLYRSWLPGMPYMDIANDGARINEIKDLIADGFLDRVLISMDVCLKTCLASYGGPGYSHIHKVAIPMMQKKGITDEQIQMITIDNPGRAFTFV
jgi:phosphotriesterase-related protein